MTHYFKIKSTIIIMGLICLATSFSPVSAQTNPMAVATFESIGLYWSPAGGSTSNTCTPRYRVTGTSQWKEGLSLWFDTRNQEYRGSLVHLTPDTNYEIELSLHSGARATLTVSTWNENFPIARTVFLSAGTSNTPLVITEGGTTNGYVLYTHPPGQESIIDVQNNHNTCVSINAPYVIVRGLICRGARIDGIQVNAGSHDVVIEENDISGWGRQSGSSTYDMDAGIGYGDKWGSAGNNFNIQRIIIQRNKIHHPRYDANSWYDSSSRVHPMGPQGLTFFRCGGNFVIRYNEIYSDEDHQFNDCIGGGENYSDTGFPNKDSDIYGNKISMCWDDAVEAEGGNKNVRIWGNYLDKTLNVFGLMVTHVGPLYIWRNISGRSLISPRHTDYINDDWFNENRGSFTKAGMHSSYGGGRVYVFHNTMLQPPASGAMQYPLGVGSGITTYSGLIQYFSRNNIAHVFRNIAVSVHEGNDNETSNLDYDLCNGTTSADSGEETHAIRGTPIYASTNDPLEFFLASNSPGYNAGVRIPNFNDSFGGSAPDMGAFEAGLPPLEFGVNAYQNSTPLSPTPQPTSTLAPTLTTTPRPTNTPIPSQPPTATQPPQPSNTPPPASCQKDQGDANCDQVINEIDLATWFNEVSGLANSQNSDFNSDGLINTLDYAILRRTVTGSR